MFASPAQYDRGEPFSTTKPAPRLQCDKPSRRPNRPGSCRRRSAACALALGDEVDEARDGLDHRAHGLPGQRLGIEDDEVGRVAFAQAQWPAGIRSQQELINTEYMKKQRG